MKNVFRAFAYVILVAGLVLGAAASRAENTIKIGFIAPFSGAFAANGDAWLKMLTYAMNKTNERGGALGKKFELVTFDDKITPSEALIALTYATSRWRFGS
jgi:branched-chain amino acid transport system substrate-binding protein